MKSMKKLKIALGTQRVVFVANRSDFLLKKALLCSGGRHIQIADEEERHSCFVCSADSGQLNSWRGLSGHLS